MESYPSRAAIKRTRRNALGACSGARFTFSSRIGITSRLVFSMIAAAQGENCCHNHELFGTRETRFFSVPYGFDMSGMKTQITISYDPSKTE